MDTKTPTITLNSNLPSSITKGDNYSIVGTVTANGPSGASYFCGSDKDGVVSNIAELTTIGTHRIYCTASSGAALNITTSKYITITYTAYTATNLVTNGSFENSMNNWTITSSNTSTASINNSYKKLGSYSANINIDTTTSCLFTLMDSKSFSTPIDHYFYLSINAYVPKIERGYIILGEIYNSEKNAFTLGGLNNLINPNNAWTKYSEILKNNSSYDASLYRFGVYEENSTTSGIGNAYFDGITVIDLTATFGAGNEPDKDWCDRHINYFDGTITIYK